MELWKCTRCGRLLGEHTMAEYYDTGCRQVVPDDHVPGHTASEFGLVNPEALENTGEEFDLGKWSNVLYDRASPGPQKTADLDELQSMHKLNQRRGQ